MVMMLMLMIVIMVMMMLMLMIVVMVMVMIMFMFMMMVVLMVVVMVMMMLMLMIVVMMMFVLVVVFMPVHISGLFFLAVDLHTDVGSGNPALLRGALFIRHTGNSERIQFLQKSFRIGHQLKKRCCQHIACRTHIAFDEKCFHVSPPVA